MTTLEETSELSKILHKDFKLDLSEKEIFEISQNLINLFELLIEIEYEKNNKKN